MPLASRDCSKGTSHEAPEAADRSSSLRCLGDAGAGTVAGQQPRSRPRRRAVRRSEDVLASRARSVVAPIALYPDALLAQVLMASTYPIEVVQADRWIAANPGLKGTALENALQSQPGIRR
jgi:hypothetical protein